MTDPTPEEPAGETWDEMAARVTAEVVSANYAAQLWASMASYRNAGFNDSQAWELTLAEHISRLNHIGQLVVMGMMNDGDQEPPTS